MSKIFGNIQDISRYARVANGTVELINGPISDDPFLITSTKKVFRSNSEGYFEVELGKGNYTLTIGRDSVLFNVTESEGDFNIITLTVRDLTVPQFPFASSWNGQRQGHIQFIFCAAPATPVISLDSSDTPTELENDVTYKYAVSYVTSTGETELCELVSISDPDMNPPEGTYKAIIIPLEVNPVGGVTKKRIWRNTEDDEETFELLASLEPSVSSYEDRESMAHFSARVAAGTSEEYPDSPTENTTAGGIYSGNVLIARVNTEGLKALLRLRIPVGTTIGMLDGEVQLNDNEAGPGIAFTVNGVTTILRRNGLRSENISFERSDFVQQDEYIGGSFKWAKATQPLSAILTCRTRPLSGAVVVALEVDGVLCDPAQYFVITPGAGEYLEEIEIGIGTVDASKSYRWKVVDGAAFSETNPTSSADYPGGISITTNLYVTT